MFWYFVDVYAYRDVVARQLMHGMVFQVVTCLAQDENQRQGTIHPHPWHPAGSTLRLDVLHRGKGGRPRPPPGRKVRREPRRGAGDRGGSRHGGVGMRCVEGITVKGIGVSE